MILPEDGYALNPTRNMENFGGMDYSFSDLAKGFNSFSMDVEQPLSMPILSKQESNSNVYPTTYQQQQQQQHQQQPQQPSQQQSQQQSQIDFGQIFMTNKTDMLSRLQETFYSPMQAFPTSGFGKSIAESFGPFESATQDYPTMNYARSPPIDMESTYQYMMNNA